jgi:hypothetical protein
MTDRTEWLEETWEIKRKLAEKYADVQPSEQVKQMRDLVVREWKKRGWTLAEPQRPGLPRGK